MKKDWIKLEEFILSHIREIDSHAERSPGSGNKGRKGDLVTKCGLKIECKDNQSLKNAYKESDMLKIIEEVPLHSQDVPILITRNNDKKIRVHMTFEDFWEIYKKSLDRQREDR
jgi:hypothetical protein